MKLGMMIVVLGMMSASVVVAEETGVCKDGKQVTGRHEISIKGNPQKVETKLTKKENSHAVNVEEKAPPAPPESK